MQKKYLAYVRNKRVDEDSEEWIIKFNSKFGKLYHLLLIDDLIITPKKIDRYPFDYIFLHLFHRLNVFEIEEM